ILRSGSKSRSYRIPPLWPPGERRSLAGSSRLFLGCPFFLSLPSGPTHRARRSSRSREFLLKYISIKGWDRFQHYTDRDPPWVKLYRDLLTSESWVLGTDTSRLVQVASILLAARYK